MHQKIIFFHFYQYFLLYSLEDFNFCLTCFISINPLDSQFVRFVLRPPYIFRMSLLKIKSRKERKKYFVTHQKFLNYFMAHQYMSKLFHDTWKNPSYILNVRSLIITLCCLLHLLIFLTKHEAARASPASSFKV